MMIFKWGKDGGTESSVWGFWLIEIKCAFSIVLLRFDKGTREAYHNHAFDAVSWLLTGHLTEYMLDGSETKEYYPSFKPIFTWKETFHKVKSNGVSWALSFRGPWADTWKEFTDRPITLTHGRKEVSK